MIDMNQLPPAIRGIIVELQDQVRVLSDRAVARAAESFDLKAENDELKAAAKKEDEHE